MLARTVSQQWTAKSTESSQGRPIQREVYPFHHASRHVHAGSKSRDLNPGTTSQVALLSVQRLSTGDLPTTGHVMKQQACASRQLRPRVSADISIHNHANQPHEAQDHTTAQDLHVNQEIAIPSGESFTQPPLQVNSDSDQSQSESGLVTKSTTGVTGTDAPTLAH